MRRSLAIIGSGILLSSIAWASAPGSADKQPTPALEAKHRMFRAEQGRWMPLPDLVPAGGAMMVMDGDPSQGAADFYVRFPAGYGVPMHMHTPSERLYMSSGTLQVRMFDGETTALAKGSFVYVPSRKPHQMTCTGEQECLFYLHVAGVFDLHLVDDRGEVTRSWSAADATAPRQQAARAPRRR